MNHRWVFALIWLAILAGFVYLRNRMTMRTVTPAAAAEDLPERWPVPPLVTLPSDTMQPAYAAAQFSGSAYRAWMSYNDALTGRVNSTALRRATLATADSLEAAASTALARLQVRLPKASAALATFETATVRIDSIVSGITQSENGELAELHNQTFEVLRQLMALK